MEHTDAERRETIAGILTEAHRMLAAVKQVDPELAAEMFPRFGAMDVEEMVETIMLRPRTELDAILFGEGEF